MIVERITKEIGVTLPKAVLDALGLKPGDEIGFDVVDGQVSLKRVSGDDGFDEDDGRSIEELTGLDIETLRAMIQEARDDPRPPVAAEEALARVLAHLDSRPRRRDAG